LPDSVLLKLLLLKLSFLEMSFGFLVACVPSVYLAQLITFAKYSRKARVPQE